MKRAVVFEAERTAYSIEQIERPMTVGELIAFLEQFDDDDLVVMSHDRGYTYGSISEAEASEWEETESGDWEQVD